MQRNPVSALNYYVNATQTIALAWHVKMSIFRKVLVCRRGLKDYHLNQPPTLFRFTGKKLKVGPSAIHGLGVFVDEPCEKADFISEYRGEIITNEEATRRAKTYKKDDCSYLFTLNNEYVLDARDYGNAVRYLNYSISPNCGAKVLRVNGDHRIGIFASCAIAAGEELTLDYCTFDPTKDQ